MALLMLIRKGMILWEKGHAFLWEEPLSKAKPNTVAGR